MPDEADHDGSAVDKPVDSVDKSMFEGPGGPARTPPDPQRGVDIARAALASARAARRRPSGQRATPPRRRRGWSGPRPDDRDPQPLGRLASRLVADRGWVDRVSAGVVFARWAQLVGADVAEHSEPVSLHEGELLVRASSTAWATQLRLLQRQLLARITACIQGPAAPTWVHGPRHVRGRGPRDTYG
jgi:predicted nucleic acid-binding Zn ribbon protein